MFTFQKIFQFWQYYGKVNGKGNVFLNVHLDKLTAEVVTCGKLSKPYMWCTGKYNSCAVKYKNPILELTQPKSYGVTYCAPQLRETVVCKSQVFRVFVAQ